MSAGNVGGLRVAVVLASAGRPALVGEIAHDLERQTYPISERLLSVPDAASVPSDLPDGWQTVTGSKGLAAQRNTALDALADEADVVVFFDDDAVPRDDYVAHVVAYFDAHADVVGVTGRVLLDGAAHSVGEVSRADALQALAESASEQSEPSGAPSRTLYGCNFAFRRDLVPEIRFDERLPLYSWLEDHDFARRLMGRGALAGISDAVIVHRGAGSGGRTNHVRLGYSQFMNPVYLHRSGSFPLWLSAWEIFRPTAKNIAYSVGGSQSTWRRERVRGNALALGDVVRGRITPERITEL